MITIEGITVIPTFESLAEGEGFLVKLKTDWYPDRRNHELTSEQQQAINEAKSKNIIGWRLNGHEDTFGDTQTRIDNEISAFVTEIIDFINDFNADST